MVPTLGDRTKVRRKLRTKIDLIIRHKKIVTVRYTDEAGSMDYKEVEQDV